RPTRKVIVLRVSGTGRGLDVTDERHRTGAGGEETVMKYMIMVYNSQLDYDAMTGRATPDRPAWSPTDLQAMYGFMESFNAELADSRRTGGHLRADATGTDTAALWAKLDGCTTPPVAG